MTENTKLEELNKRKEEYLKELERVNGELKKLEDPNNPSDLNSSKDPKKFLFYVTDGRHKKSQSIRYPGL